MGAILAATPAMGPWHVEVRRQSAYVTTDDLATAPRLADDGTLRMPAAQAPHLVAALDQIMERVEYKDGPDEWDVNGDDVIADFPTVRRDGDWIIFSGFCGAYRPNERDDIEVDADIRNYLEIEYYHVHQLRDMLAAAARDGR